MKSSGRFLAQTDETNRSRSAIQHICSHDSLSYSGLRLHLQELAVTLPSLHVVAVGSRFFSQTMLDAAWFES